MRLQDVERARVLSLELADAQGLAALADQTNRYKGRRFKLMLECNDCPRQDEDDWKPCRAGPVGVYFEAGLNFLHNHIATLKFQLTELGVTVP